ncbi:hypothetical protein HAX54_049710 [Datura stramonium]|uniref:Uncharacterized protein n=1 Tax=Datura stramonium TaxID=4076 RepID=A0ABS8SW70_DATST|nr:hypothetical protein [Datura stramonium]
MNLMPLDIYKNYGLSMLNSTSIRLQMADKTIKKPIRVVEDVLVKVQKFVLLDDFELGTSLWLMLSVDEVVEHAIATSPKRKEDKSKWVKRYLVSCRDVKSGASWEATKGY